MFMAIYKYERQKSFEARNSSTVSEDIKKGDTFSNIGDKYILV